LIFQWANNSNMANAFDMNVASINLDIEKIRADFPILQREVYKKPLAYFDNAATTQKPIQVIDAEADVYKNINSNIHRGVHHLSNLCTEAFEESRKKVAAFLNAEHHHEIIFTRGTTESINLVAHSFGATFLKAGDEVIVSHLEHHSNIVPWQMLEASRGVVLKVVPITDAGELDMEAYKTLVGPNTKLVAIAHVSNALGTINPIREIIDIAHAQNIPVLIDGAQAVQHIAVDVQSLDCDFYAFSGHKLFGPTGIGVLYGKEKWLNQMAPYQGGGEMIQTVSFSGTTFNELPFKFEAGTPNFAGAVALAAAIDYVLAIGLKNIADYEEYLRSYATEALLTIEGLRIYGTAPHKSGVISFLVDNIHPFDMGTMLDKMGIAVRTGHHCAQPLMERYGISGTVRASFAFYNTTDEIDRLVAGVAKVKQMFA
jgi:cysteine desulfurase / selenocysteine lyase